MIARTIALWLVLMGICTAACAQETEQSVNNQRFAQIAFELEESAQSLREAAAICESEDAQILFSGASGIIQMTQTAMLSSMQENPEILELEEGTISQQGMTEERSNTLNCQTGVIQLTDADLYMTGSAIARDGYIQARYSLYSITGAYIGTRRLEYAQREDGTALVLIVDYDNVMHATGRFAMRLEEGAVDIIFTKTLGMNMDIVLDVSAWQMGDEISDWSKDLLLPVSTMN